MQSGEGEKLGAAEIEAGRVTEAAIARRLAARSALKALRTRPKRRMKMADAPALIGFRNQNGKARWRLDDVSILGL
jgi:hypothetical protein